MKFIEMENKKVLKNLLILCKEIKPTINIKKIESIALTTIKYLTSSKEKRQKLQYNQTLEKKWYKYLKKGKKYYEVYADDKYIAELWACYIVYSKKYLKMIFHPTKGITDQLKNIKSILDLGCGFGHTTINLKEYFPNSMVYGSNIKNTLQIKVAYKLSKKYNFKIISDLNKLNKKIDLLFASEYFEHIEKPIDNLLFIINKFNPKYLLIANSFGTSLICFGSRGCISLLQCVIFLFFKSPIRLEYLSEFPISHPLIPENINATNKTPGIMSPKLKPSSVPIPIKKEMAEKINAIKPTPPNTGYASDGNAL